MRVLLSCYLAIGKSNKTYEIYIKLSLKLWFSLTDLIFSGLNFNGE